MYVPPHFVSPSREAECALMRAHPLATLVWQDGGGLQATPLPLLLRESGDGVLTLAAHLPRANPLVQHLMKGPQTLLAVFHGPDAYVSPNWYPSKAETHRQVPTWNYATVHAHGTAHLHDDPAWVRAQLEALTATHEATQPQPWTLAEAPPDYLAALLRVLVGLELRVTRVEGKFKLSQNRDARDLDGVRAALAGSDMAALMQQA